jgi:hypothetical protein
MGHEPKRILIVDDHSHFVKLMAARIRRAVGAMGPGFDVCPGVLDWAESVSLCDGDERVHGVHLVSMTHSAALRHSAWGGLYCAFVDVRDEMRSWDEARRRDDTPENYLAGIEVARHLGDVKPTPRTIVYSSELHNPYLWLPLYQMTNPVVTAYYHVDGLSSDAAMLSALRDPEPVGAVTAPTELDYARLGMSSHAPLGETLDDLRSSAHWSLFAGVQAYRELPQATRKWLDRRAARDGIELPGGRRLFELLRHMTSPEEFRRSPD